MGTLKVTSSFEHSFRRSVNVIKVSKEALYRGDQVRLADIPIKSPSLHGVSYEFWQRAGTDERSLGSLVVVRGPLIKPTGLAKDSQIVAFIHSNGRVQWNGSVGGTSAIGNATRLYVEMAIEQFWKKLDISPLAAKGWEILDHIDSSGSITILRRMPSGYMKETSIVYASMPSRRLDFFDPTGKKAADTTKIPVGVVHDIRQRFEKAGIFQYLLNAYHGKGSRVTTHPDGLILG